MQTDLIADILLSVTLSSHVQGRIAKNPEQEVKQCRSFACPHPPLSALIFRQNLFAFAGKLYFSS